MISFEKRVLENGLRVIVHEDHDTPMACVNLLYDVGSRDEDPNQTGFAHLFEHLMFGGSKNIIDFDTPLQTVGGESNAFTSPDITNYYVTLPADNIETAFWLESDRMLALEFSEQSLRVQKQVVIEEFKQRYLNQPYGDVWLKLRPLAYTKHPYRWATIGKEISHIENATLEDVKRFFYRFYAPNNAVLVVSGAVNTDEIFTLAEKWFGPIEKRHVLDRQLPKEPNQTQAKRLEVKAKVPSDSLYIAYHGVDRMHPDYYAMDLITDVLSRGASSRLIQNLIKKNPVFSYVNAYVSGSIDQNLLILEGKPLPGVTLDKAEELLLSEINQIKNEKIANYELEKILNKIESAKTFEQLSILDKAMNLAYYELLYNDPSKYNTDFQEYRKVKPEDISRVAQSIIKEENSSTLIYKSLLKNDK